LYNEPYRGVPMRSTVERDQETIALTHRVRLRGRSYGLRVEAGTSTRQPDPAEREHFFKEHQWGYGTTRSGKLLRYRVDHPTWLVHPVQQVALDWDWARIYGERWAFLQEREPDSRIVAVGSAVAVYPKGSMVPPLIENGA